MIDELLMNKGSSDFIYIYIVSTRNKVLTNLLCLNVVAKYGRLP